MPKPYKDTSKATNALQTPKKGQNERQTQVTLADVINSILTFGFLAGALFILALFLPQKAHSYASLTNYPAKQVKNNLPLVVSIGQNTATTKYIAVKPNRHSLAIFVPKICLTNYQRFTNGINKNTSALQARHKYSTVESANIYDGLIEPNTIALVVNKLNRLVTVVKTRRPFFMGDYKLTKLLGAIHNG